MFTTVRKVLVNDPSRFEGNGISYKAKLIGIEDVAEARGDLMCQEAMTKLKNSVKISGVHKRKIFVNVTLEGLRIIDAISLASVQNKKKVEPKSPKLAPGSEQSQPGQDVIVLHIHPVHRISFISRDVTDTRAFGYVFGTEDGLHKFFAIKTASAAESLVLTLRDLFQVVYQMKKKEVETAKEKLDKVEITTNGQKENLQTSGEGSISGTGQTQTQTANAEPENIYQGIEQIKNLEFDSVDKDSFASPSSPATSPLTKLSLSPLSSTSSANDDPWGLSANSSSSLGDLTGLQSATFNQSFASAPFPAQSGFGSPVAFNSASGGLPLTQDPFASDPFGSVAQQPQLQVSSGFGLTRPFAPGFAQAYGMQAMPQRVGVMGAMGVMPGMVPHGMMSPPVMGAMRSPFFIPQSPGLQMGNAFAEDPNILQPMKKDGRQDVNAGSPEPVKSPIKTREDLFGDLLNIRKSAPSTAKSPKDMFAQRNAGERKPMNEMAGPGKISFPVSAQNKQAQASCDPFGDLDSVILDKTRGLLLSDGGEEDPFDTSFIPPLLAESSHHAQSSLACIIPPPVPSRQSSSHSHTDTSPMPSSPPPPPPPPTLSSRHTPPPPRRAHKPDTLKDINENITTSPCDIHASHLSCLPPSPIEPPPPLPPHIVVEPTSCAPASPSSPRPQVQCTQTVPGVSDRISGTKCTQTVPGVSDRISGTKCTQAVPRVSDRISGTKCTQTVPGASDRISGTKCTHSNLSDKSSHTQHVVQSNTCESQTSQPAGNTDVWFYLSDRETPTNIVQTCNHMDTLTPGGDNLSSREREVNSHQSDWVAFENCDDLSETPSAFIFSALRTNDDDDNDDDPFNVPVHLPPGFKAVAKFGSDPFDDCLGESVGQAAWDPFCDVQLGLPEAGQGSSENSPFGDPFLPAVQQAASKSLFD